MRALRSSERASVTLVALCFTAVLAIALTSYVVLCQRSYDFSTRQMFDDKVRQLAQTGLEESLWALNQSNWSSSGPSNSVAWSGTTTRTATIPYTSLGQGASGQLVLTIANATSAGPTWPTITSIATLTLPSGRTMTKTLQATTRPAPLFNNAIASASSYVSFTNTGTVDSWNSDPGGTGSYTTPYSFSATSPANFAAVVAGNTDGTGAPNGPNGVILNQAQIRGYAATFGNRISYSTSGSPKGQVQGPGATVDVDEARVGKSAFIPTASVFTVNTPSAPPTNIISSILALVAKLLGLVPSGTEVYEFSGDLVINGVPLLSPDLVIEHPVTIVVDGNLLIGTSGLTTGQIIIKPTGSLQLFVAGDVTISGDGFDNQTHDPRKLAIFCTDSSTLNSLQYSTSNPSTFYGVIYCLNKPIDIRQNATFYGALLSSQYVRFSTNATAPTFHYDTALRKVRFNYVSTPYLIDQLTEP